MGSIPIPATQLNQLFSFICCMNNNPIGIFDSGVGGLSIAEQVKKEFPHENIIYVADQAYMPYGAKTPNEIQERAWKIVSFMIENRVKAVIVACNTATIMAIDALRRDFELPIIGTVPVVKTIAENTKTNNIAIFATPLTSKSTYLQELIEKFAKGKTVFMIGESHLEDLIENGETDSSEIQRILEEQLTPLIAENVDVIALGCTHYPFIKSAIESVVGKKIGVFDSGGAIARRLRVVLEHENLLSEEKRKDLYYTTGDSQKFMGVASKLMKREIEAEHVDL